MTGVQRQIVERPFRRGKDQVDGIVASFTRRTGKAGSASFARNSASRSRCISRPARVSPIHHYCEPVTCVMMADIELNLTLISRVSENLSTRK